MDGRIPGIIGPSLPSLMGLVGQYAIQHRCDGPGPGSLVLPPEQQGDVCASSGCGGCLPGVRDYLVDLSIRLGSWLRLRAIYDGRLLWIL